MAATFIFLQLRIEFTAGKSHAVRSMVRTIQETAERRHVQSLNGNKAARISLAQNGTKLDGPFHGEEPHSSHQLASAQRVEQTVTQHRTPLPEYVRVVKSHKTSELNNVSEHSGIISPGSFGSSSNLSYLLALSFCEQLSSASQSMLRMAPLAVDWKAHMVEPVVLTSRLFGIEGVYPHQILTPLHSNPLHVQQSIQLSQVYDLAKLNAVLHSHISPTVTMATFEHFVTSAPKEIILLHFNKFYSIDFSLNQNEFQAVNYVHTHKGDVIECTNLQTAKGWAQKIESRLNAFLSDFTSERFRVGKVLCLSNGKVFDSRQLLAHFSLPATIIFTTWQGCPGNCSIGSKRTTGSQSLPSGTYRTAAVLTEASFLRPFHLESIHTLHSSHIRETAEKYLEFLGVRTPFLAVHIRSERLLKDGIRIMKNPFYYNCCLQQLKNIVHNLQDEHGYRQSLVISDTGSKYGTVGCGNFSKYCTEQSAMVIARTLEFLNFTVASYDPVAFNTTENSGFVSLVEMHMLSMGERLVLVGRGGFEAILENLFLQPGEGHRHHGRNVYRVCMGSTPSVTNPCS